MGGTLLRGNCLGKGNFALHALPVLYASLLGIVVTIY